MRLKLIALVGAIILLAAACGESTTDTVAEPTDTSADTASDAAATAEDPAPADSLPETTEEPVVEEPEPPVEETNPLLETALSIQGTWTGEWNNTTFGSTGPIEGEITVDEVAMELIVNSDVGGNVFGASDPDPEMLTLPLVVGDHTGSSPVFGDWTLTINEDGTFSMVSVNMPALPDGAQFTMTGALTDAGITGDYLVDFGDGGSPAEGTITITKS